MHFRKATFFLIVLIYCMLSFFYAALTPPWESPDEPAHYLYVSELAERWSPPQRSLIKQKASTFKDQAYITSNYEWYQPSLGYLPAAIIYKIITIVAPQSLPMQMPTLNPQISPDHKNIFLHPDSGILNNWKGNWGLLVIRFISSLMGLPVILAVYRLGNLVDKKNGLLGIATAGWVAFLPQFVFINASVRSDTLTNALAALVILTAALLQTSETHSDRYALLIGVLLGLGLLSKNTFIYMLPIGVVVVILKNPRSPRNWFQLCAFVYVPVLILWGTYYIVSDEARIALSYTITTTLKVNPTLLTWEHMLGILRPLLIDLFFARFGWANVAPPAIWSWLAFILWSAGSCITIFQALHLSRKAERTPQLKIIILLFMGMLLAFIGVIRFNLSVVQPQGRFLYPALLPWSILGFWGISQRLSRLSEEIATILIISFMLLFNIYALFFVLAPTYWS